MGLLLWMACGDVEPAETSCSPTDEVCDGVDSDCDGRVDEGVTDTVYADADGDGLGDPAAPQAACGTDWPGYSANADDCDDTNATWPVEAWPDADGDGFGALGSESTWVCDLTGYANESTDCDDEDAAIHPSADEVCGNGIDDNCDDTGAACPDSGPG